MKGPFNPPDKENKQVNITSQQFTAKYQSKLELYKFVATECNIYLSSYETVTVWHLRDICAGKRRIIHSQDVKHIHVPHFEGLTI